MINKIVKPIFSMWLKYFLTQQDGFLGVESAREDLGITVSYWKDEKSIINWKANLEHQSAQKTGKELWYKQYKVRIAKVERDYQF